MTESGTAKQFVEELARMTKLVLETQQNFSDLPDEERNELVRKIVNQRIRRVARMLDYTEGEKVSRAFVESYIVISLIEEKLGIKFTFEERLAAAVSGAMRAESTSPNYIG
jgi:hypothetical protein